MLETVLQYGTGRAAAIGQFAAGKTGTTSNYGDAWFVGWDTKYTVAVWVGYPDKLIPMTTGFNGQPVLGGTFPALIWHDFMTQALQIDKARTEHTKETSGAENGTGSVSSEVAPAGSSAGTGQAQGNSQSSGSKSKGNTPAPSGAGRESGVAAPDAEHAPSAPSTPAPARETPSSAEAPAAAAAPASPSPTGGVSPGG